MIVYIYIIAQTSPKEAFFAPPAAASASAGGENTPPQTSGSKRKRCCRAMEAACILQKGKHDSHVWFGFCVSVFVPSLS